MYWYIPLIVIIIILIICAFLFQQIKENHDGDDPVLYRLKQKLKMIDPSIENFELYKGNKSYTINKKKVYLCIKDENGNYYDDNTLIYVFLHEIAHVLCTEIGHTDGFYDIFNDLLDKAAGLGMYNGKPIVSNYCNY